ncbi:MAG TPA: hypothetical protein GX707_20000 [Epulopiscium sp.]|nr:hypothetical protein [Candidatus Epulonipiscium sp.]
MVTLPIINNNLFMNCLLKQNLFDTFEVREVTLHTSYKMHLDGRRNTDFYDDMESEGRSECQGLSEYLSWSELKPHIFELIKGTKSPTYLKIILSTSPLKTQEISEEASTFFLNITYKEGAISCITGTAYASFSLDKTPEQAWDQKMTKFLISNNLL